MTKRNDQLIQSVQRACLLMQAIGTDGEAGVRELAKNLGLGKSTVHRLACTLEQMGYLRQSNETAKYDLSLKLLELGTQALERFGLRDIALPVVQDLARETRESAHMAVWDQGSAVFIECFGFTHILRVYAHPGQRVPSFCTAVGKAMLAYRRAEEIDAVLRNGLRGYTERTLVIKEELLRDLERVRAQGFSTNDEEHEVGLRAAAAPIWDHMGSVVAAVGIAGPASRVKREDLPAFGELARKAGLDISKHLGYSSQRAARGTRSN